VNIVIDEGWHINGHEPAQDFLVATRLTFELPEGDDGQLGSLPSACNASLGCRRRS